MTIYYVDLENGDDTNSGLDFANRKKTLDFSNSISELDEVRVMASPDAQSIGNATWCQQEVTASEDLHYVHNESGQIKIQLSSNYAWYYPDNGYVIIQGSSITGLNGLWKTTNVTGEYFVLQNSSFSTLGVSSGASSGGATIQSINGKIVTIAGEQVKGFVPIWTAVTVANPASDWTNVLGGIDGATHNGSAVSTGAFKSIPGTSWRLEWNSTSSSNNYLTVTEKPYYDARTSSSSWSNAYSSYYGADNSSRSVYFGYYYRHIFNGYTGYYITVNSNSYINIGHYSSTNYPTATNPYYRNYKIGARNSEMYRVRYRSMSSNDHPNYSDMGSSTGYLVWYAGNRQDPSSQTYRPAEDNYEIEWTAYFFSAAGGNKTVQIDIHNNIDWEFVTLEPSVTSVTGYSGAGSQLDVGGAPANTTIFWENFASALDLSSYDTLSFYMKTNGTLTNNYKLRLHEGTYDSGASYQEYTLPVTTTSSDWTNIAFSAVGGSLSNNIQAISVHYDGTTSAASASFSLSDFLAVSSTGLNFASYIGRNTTDSPFWYRVGNIRFDGTNTLVTIQGSTFDSETQAGGLAYFGSVTNPPDLTDNSNVIFSTVETFVRSPITIPSDISLTRNNLTIRGGWDRTSMGSQVSDTWVYRNATTGTPFSLQGDGVYFSNFHATGGGTPLYCSSFLGSQLENCTASYGNDVGIYQNITYSSKITNCNVLGCGIGLYYRDSQGSDIQNCRIEGNNEGIARRDRKIADINTYDCLVRGCQSHAIKTYMAISCHDYNLTLSSNKSNAFYHEYSTDARMINGKIIKARSSDSNSYIYYNVRGSEMFFDNVEMKELPEYQTSAAYSRMHPLHVEGPMPDGSGLRSFRQWDYANVRLSRKPGLTAPSGTLPDGSTDSGNNVYEWQRVSTNNYDWKRRNNGPTIKLGAVPVTAGSVVQVSAYVQQRGNGYGRLQVYCDATESTIGLTDDVEEDFFGGGTTWTQYTLNVTAVTDGLAHLYMSYFIDGSNTTATDTYIYYTDLEITVI